MINPSFHGCGNTCELSTLLTKCTRASMETSSKYMALSSFKDSIILRNNNISVY